MKICTILTFVWLSFGHAFAQQTNLDSLESRQAPQPSTFQLESLTQSFYQSSDSIKNVHKARVGKMDSAQRKLETKLDSLRSLQASVTELPGPKFDSLQERVAGTMDSVALRLKSSRISNAIDSIKSLRETELANLNQKIQNLKDHTIGELSALELPPALDDKLSTVTNNINDFKISGSELNLSSVNSTVNMPNLDGLNVASVPSGLKNIGELSNINNGLGIPSDIADVKQVASGNVGGINDLPQAAEMKLAEVSGINEVKQQTQALEQYKEMAGGMQNPDSLKAVLKQEITKAAVNHFAGQQQQLQQAMETVAKYQNKYSSLKSLSDVKKRPPNMMKGKPLIERIVPGIAMQLQMENDASMIDFNGYAGYRFTGRIMAGAGWNQRVAYSFDKKTFHPEATIFGPRLFGEFKLWKGFSPRLEGEVMNTKVPPFIRTTSNDPHHREWVWGAFLGFKKEYRFIKNVKGTAMVMTRLFNPGNKSPYADVWSARFGFEFPTKKKGK